jgi:endo-1,4-beta-D-glucanase Y
MLVSERDTEPIQATPPPRRRGRSRLLIVAAAVAALALAAVAAVIVSGGSGGSSVSSSSASAPTSGGPAVAAARSFLRQYVDPDGRVVRRDQGNDTVSEGQAYALLLADAAGDQATFARVWTWTRGHLQEPNGLFAFRANPDGTVADPQPASDADLLIAWALVRATGPLAAEYHREGLSIADAVLAHETVRRGDTLMLAAGPWAVGHPVTLDPSYWAPAAFEQLANITGDFRWRDLDAGTIRLSNDLMSGGTVLPPDWARVDKTLPVATAAPDRSSRFIQYGLDAQRLPVWLATSCDARGPRLAARLDPLLSSKENALALTPDGQILNQETNATPVIGAAAAAQAAGNDSRRDSLFAEAARLNQEHPTYYGTAWLALGRTLLTTHLLGGCQ